MPLMTSIRRFVPPALLVVALGAGSAVLASCSSTGTPPPAPQRPVVAVIRAEPRSFNRLARADRPTGLLSMLLHARLVQLNHHTQEIEPALATKWTLDKDGRTYTLTLRQ